MLIGLFLEIIIFLLFYPLNPIDNKQMFSSVIGLKFDDWSIFAALFIGIGTILCTLYSINKSFKSMKLSSIPEKSTNLLIELEFHFNQYKLGTKKDELILLTEILKYWNENQKAFRLLTPHFYKNFLKLMLTPENINKNENLPNKNSKYIIMAIKAQITDIAFENNDCEFSFIKPNLINDDENIEKNGENSKNYTKININQKEFYNYITTIKGEKTKRTTSTKFKMLNNDIKHLLKDLKREIDEYD
ncbi:hypothetical protein [Methanobrevibacter sp.]|uniref:hypothetical protein n=1 Tax=Methanobrevibacter sp. TaxID=66852 RepID=UPI00388F30F0